MTHNTHTHTQAMLVIFYVFDPLSLRKSRVVEMKQLEMAGREVNVDPVEVGVAKLSYLHTLCTYHAHAGALASRIHTNTHIFIACSCSS